MEITITFNTASASPRELDAFIALIAAARSTSSLEIELPDETEQAGTDLIELSDEQVNDAISKMHALAIASDEGKDLKATALYGVAVRSDWGQLSPNTRKAIGRRFRKFTENHEEQADYGEIVIRFKERNLQNMAIYQAVRK